MESIVHAVSMGKLIVQFDILGYSWYCGGYDACTLVRSHSAHSGVHARYSTRPQ